MRQRGSVSVCAASLCLQTEWAWFHSDRQSQSETDVLAPVVIRDLKHRLQTGFVGSVGLPLLLAM